MDYLFAILRHLQHYLSHSRTMGVCNVIPFAVEKISVFGYIPAGN